MKAVMTLIALSLLGLAGCSSNHDSDDDNNAEVDFTAFVKSEIKNTQDDRDAVDVNDVTFSFNDQDDPDAYDDILQ
ncbi:hypothetical protein [Marinobacter sp. NFXS9]